MSTAQSTGTGPDFPVSASAIIRNKIRDLAPSMLDSDGRLRVSDLITKLTTNLPHFNQGTIKSVIYMSTRSGGAHGYRRLRKFIHQPKGEVKVQPQVQEKSRVKTNGHLRAGEGRAFLTGVIYDMLRTGKYGGVTAGSVIHGRKIALDLMTSTNRKEGQAYRMLNMVARRDPKTEAWTLIRGVPGIKAQVKSIQARTKEQVPGGISQELSPMQETCSALMMLEQAISILKRSPLSGSLNGIVHDLLG